MLNLRLIALPSYGKFSGPSAETVAAIFKALPKDTALLRADYQPLSAISFLTLYCPRFTEIQEGELIPVLRIEVNKVNGENIATLSDPKTGEIYVGTANLSMIQT